MSIASRDLSAVPSYKAEWWTPQLVWPLIAAVVVRLTLLAVLIARGGTSILISADTSSYLEPGRNLLLHGRFIADGVPDLFRTPGYPLFLAFFSYAGLTVAALVQVILSVFSVLLVWKLGRAVFNDNRIALGAAWLLAFEPITVTYSVLLTAETLFLTLFLLSMERLAEFIRGRSLWVQAAAGMWLAAATFVRPVTYYLPYALAVGLFFVLARMPSFSPQRQRPVARDPSLHWKAPAVLLISVLPWLAAWQVRNWVETGYSGFSSVKDVNLYFFSVPNVIASAENKDIIDVQNEFAGKMCGRGCNEQLYLYQPYLALHPEQAGWSQNQRLTYIHSEAVRIIRAHYGVYLRSCFANLLKVVIRLGSGSFDNLIYPQAGLVNGEEPIHTGAALIKTYPLIAIEKVYFAVLLLGYYFFTACGIYRLARGFYRSQVHAGPLCLLLGVSVYFLAVIGVGGGTAADARLRLPITPVVCILAAAGFCRSWTSEQPSAQSD
jgi:hypothetical protein